jgi:hypothetical protein
MDFKAQLKKQRRSKHTVKFDNQSNESNELNESKDQPDENPEEASYNKTIDNLGETRDEIDLCGKMTCPSRP